MGGGVGRIKNRAAELSTLTSLVLPAGVERVEIWALAGPGAIDDGEGWRIGGRLAVRLVRVGSSGAQWLIFSLFRGA